MLTFKVSFYRNNFKIDKPNQQLETVCQPRQNYVIILEYYYSITQYIEKAKSFTTVFLKEFKYCWMIIQILNTFSLLLEKCVYSFLPVYEVHKINIIMAKDCMESVANNNSNYFSFFSTQLIFMDPNNKLYFTEACPAVRHTGALAPPPHLNILLMKFEIVCFYP